MRLWSTTHQEQVICPIYGLGESNKDFVEVVRELRRASIGWNELQVPRLDKSTALLDIKEGQLRHTEVDRTRSDCGRKMSTGPVIFSFEEVGSGLPRCLDPPRMEPNHGGRVIRKRRESKYLAPEHERAVQYSSRLVSTY